MSAMALKETGTTVSGGIRALPRLGVADFIVMGVAGDRLSAIKAKSKNRNFWSGEWPNFTKNGLSVRMQGHKKKKAVRGVRYSMRASWRCNGPEKVQTRRTRLGGAQWVEREKPKWFKEQEESVTFEGSSAVIRRTIRINGFQDDESVV